MLTWSDRLLLGFPEIDAEHREFVDCVQALQLAAWMCKQRWGAKPVVIRRGHVAAKTVTQFPGSGTGPGLPGLA